MSDLIGGIRFWTYKEMIAARRRIDSEVVLCAKCRHSWIDHGSYVYGDCVKCPERINGRKRRPHSFR